MIKKEKKKQTLLERSPYMYYVTNWGFIDESTNNQSKNKKESVTVR